MSESDNLKEKATALEGLVEQWFFEAFHGSVVARSTEVWNAVHAAKEDLKQRLSDLLTQSTGSTPNS